MNENDIAKIVVDTAFQMHTKLGPGLLETLYESILASELERRGLEVARQPVMPVFYDGVRHEVGFRADLVVEKLVIVEVKSVEAIVPIHTKQLLTYLRLSRLKLGLLINFNSYLIKDGISRVVNDLPESA